MSEEVPRRMRRFHREDDYKPTEEHVKDKSGEIALREVDSFKNKNERYPNREELNEISTNVFEQLKSDLKEEKETKKEISDELALSEESPIGLEHIGSEESFLEKRKQKRALLKQQRQLTKDEKKKELSPKEELHKITRGEKVGSLHKHGKSDITSLEKMSEPTNETLPGSEVESIPDLLKEDPVFEEKPAEGEDIKSLLGMDEIGSLEKGLEEEDDSEVIEKELETPHNTCPSCNNKAKNLLYCPSCGHAFCDHCAKKVEVLQEGVKYTCPKCSFEFKKKKP